MNHRIHQLLVQLLDETERQPVTTYSSTMLAGLQELREHLGGESAALDLQTALQQSDEAHRLLREARVHIARVASVGAQRLASEINDHICSREVRHG